MCFADMVRYFQQINYCKVVDSYKFSSVACKHEEGGFALKKLTVL